MKLPRFSSASRIVSEKLHSDNAKLTRTAKQSHARVYCWAQPVQPYARGSAYVARWAHARGFRRCLSTSFRRRLARARGTPITASPPAKSSRLGGLPKPKHEKRTFRYRNTPTRQAIWSDRDVDENMRTIYVYSYVRNSFPETALTICQINDSEDLKKNTRPSFRRTCRVAHQTLFITTMLCSYRMCR